MRLALHTNQEEGEMEISAVDKGLMISIQDGGGCGFIIIPNDEVVEFKRLLDSVIKEIEVEEEHDVFSKACAVIEKPAQAKEKTLVAFTEDLTGYPNVNVSAFKEWMLYKKYKTKAPVTKIKNMMDRYSHSQQQQMVDTSIMNNYKGLFEPKAQQQQSFKMQDKKRTEDSMDAFFDARENGFDLRNLRTEEVNCEVIEQK